MTTLDRLVGKLGPWVFAEGVSSFLHGLVVLLPSLALTLLVPAPFGARAGLVWAAYWEQFYARREWSQYHSAKAQAAAEAWPAEKWLNSRNDCVRDFAYTIVPFVIATGTAIEVLL